MSVMHARHCFCPLCCCGWVQQADGSWSTDCGVDGIDDHKKAPKYCTHCRARVIAEPYDFDAEESE